MAENEKDLAKNQFEKRVLEAVQQLKEGETTTSIEEIEVTKIKGGYTVKLRGMDFAIIDDEGKFSYNKANLKEIKQALKDEGLTFDDLGLPDLEQAIDQEEKEQKSKENNKKEEQEKSKEDDETKEKDEVADKDIEKDKEEIAEKLGIEPQKIYPIRQDSAFYKNHPGMFPGKNLFFFEDKQGKIKVGTRDEKGKPVEDNTHFTSREVGKMQPVIRLGNGRKDVEKRIPLQTIEIENPAKENGEEDIHDRYIAVYKGNGGYLEFDEVEQSRETGKAVGERIEINSKEYNTNKINEQTNNRNGGQNPGDTTKAYNAMEKSSYGDDGVQPKEVFSLEEQIKEDLTKNYGPMNPERLEKMTKDVMKLLDTEKYDDAIAKVGVTPREKGGRTPGERRIPRGE